MRKPFVQVWDEDKKSIFPGDKGAPLTVENKNVENVQIGIVSVGKQMKKLSTRENPTIFTKNVKLS